jgi:chorismate-pyruvate lyase
MNFSNARSIASVQWQPAERLWARRTRVALRSAPLLLREMFLPAFGSV